MPRTHNVGNDVRARAPHSRSAQWQRHGQLGAPPAGAADSTGQATGKALSLMPPLASCSQIWSWYTAAGTDVESANAELAQIEAEFAKFVAAHAKTDAVIEKLHAGQDEAHVHARADANASGEANTKVHVHACDDAHTRSGV